jgi:hypothetical protein
MARSTASVGFTTLAVVFALACALGCESIQVTTDFTRNFRFSSVETYAWLPDPPGHAGDPVLHNALIAERVRGAVDRELRAMGYREAPVAEANVHVAYYVGLESRVSWQMISRSYHYSGGGRLDRHTTQTALREFDQGTLLIDVLDPALRRLVWRGTAQARVRASTDPETRRERIDAAVAKILALFPPAGPQFRPNAPRREPTPPA